MTDGWPSADPRAIARIGADAMAAADHAAAIAALRREASAEALQATLRDIRAVLLSADPKAMRRSVGFIGRLLGRDIVLGAEADALRERLGVLVMQAAAHAERLRQSRDDLEAHRLRLAAAGEALSREIDALAAHRPASDADPASPLANAVERRRAHLATVRDAYAITAGQLGIVAHNAGAIAERYAGLLPRLALLLDQQRGLRAGAALGMQLSSAHRMIDALDQYIAHHPSPAPSTAPAPVHPEGP